MNPNTKDKCYQLPRSCMHVCIYAVLFEHWLSLHWITKHATDPSYWREHVTHGLHWFNWICAPLSRMTDLPVTGLFKRLLNHTADAHGNMREHFISLQRISSMSLSKSYSELPVWGAFVLCIYIYIHRNAKKKSHVVIWIVGYNMWNIKEMIDIDCVFTSVMI